MVTPRHREDVDISLISKLAMRLWSCTSPLGSGRGGPARRAARPPHRYPQQEDLRNRVGPQHQQYSVEYTSHENEAISADESWHTMTTPTHGADVDSLRATAQQICATAEQLIAKTTWSL